MRRRSPLGIVAVASLLLSGCGGSVPEGAIDAESQAAPEGHPDHDPVQPVGPGGALEIEAGDFFFDILGGEPVTGEIDVTGINQADQFHDIHFAGAAEGSEVVEMEAGESDTATVLLFPGEWTIWCSVPGHREAGMEATVTVYATEEEAAEAAEEGELPGADDEDGGGQDADEDEVDAVDPAA